MSRSVNPYVELHMAGSLRRIVGIATSFSYDKIKIQFYFIIRFNITGAFKPNPIKFCYFFPSVTALIDGNVLITNHIVFV